MEYVDYLITREDNLMTFIKSCMLQIKKLRKNEFHRAVFSIIDKGQMKLVSLVDLESKIAFQVLFHSNIIQNKFLDFFVVTRL